MNQWGQIKSHGTCPGGKEILNYLYGRYALACTWLAKIFGEDAGKISNEFLAELSDMQDFALLGKIRKIAEQVCWNK